MRVKLDSVVASGRSARPHPRSGTGPTRRIGWRLVLALTLGLFGTACSSSTSPEDDQKNLRERADLFWRLRMDRDWIRQYDLWEPSFKSQYDLNSFVQSQGTRTRYLEFTIEDVRTDGDKGVVKVKYLYQLEGHPTLKPEPTFRTVENQWLKEDGAWYLKCPDEILRGPVGGGIQPPPPRTPDDNVPSDDSDREDE